MTQDIEHPYTIYMFFSEKCVFGSFAHLKNGLLVILLLTCKIYLYVIDPDPYQICDSQLFSYILWVVFSLS